jgi:DNA repair protein RecN (Recombination protein N)
VLDQLRVENLLLLEAAELRLAPGLNVLTGETGAGKTLLAEALTLLLGGRARRGVVRPGAGEAFVEGIFSLPPGLSDGGMVPADAGEVVLARRVWPDGRTRAYVCGRTATAAQLQQLGGRLVSFYGQHEHRRLTLASAQLEILDAQCGPAQREDRARAALAHERVRELEARLRELRGLAEARERELDLLAHELSEIEAAALSEGEKEELAAQRERLRHLEALQVAAAAATAAVASDEDGGVAGRIAGAERALETAAAIDPALARALERLEAVRLECEDIGRDLRAYLAELDGGADEGPPATARLQELEERLALVHRLERKYGGAIAHVAAHAQRCRERIAELEGARLALPEVESELAAAKSELGGLATQLGRRRRAVAPALARAVTERLAELAMPEARIEVLVRERDGGPGPRGADAIELMIETHPGAAMQPLREVASGGELSRVMLALLSVAHGEATAPTGEQPLLVFDEIDAGIGGHTARAVGQHLRRLARGRQLLCITHLPQVAALADRHFTIVKDLSRRPARTTVTELDRATVVRELVRMMGAAEDDGAAREHARQLLRAAA